MINISLLQYSKTCSFSPLRSWPNSILKGFNDAARMLSG
eukprot:CAMPEP_0172594596 /NCGR_PEP_ID=MMETSP1068-20121228/14032_1 /TAXON_ID=35684 /ORGANISM="Pseudopedinella elastica, Strain CCMP716" /LENGTH=38 /DNA_ID= /DNA_START= /DNA_END= /DNA_ORIENTATION=